MSALVYLMGMRLKHTLLETVRKPSRLILSALMLGIFAFVLWSGQEQQSVSMGALRDVGEVSALMLGLYLLMFCLTASSGMQHGATFFTMADVNMLFSAPLSSKRILLYGLVRQMGTSLLAALFLVYQYSWMHGVYDLALWQIFLILIGYGVTVFLSTLTAMLLYTFIDGLENRSRAMKAGLIALVVLVLAWVLVPALADRQNALAIVTAQANAAWIDFLPVFGWARGMSVAFMQGAWLQGALYAALCCALVAAEVFAVSKLHSDYYEDVLQATERTANAITARKEGRLYDTASVKQVKRTGIGRGMGASAFYYKQLLEMKRARVFLFDTITLVFMGCAVGFAFFTREMGLYPTLFFAVYLQIIGSGTGRWLRELTLPFVYRIPEPAHIKLLMIVRSAFFPLILESTIIFVAVGLIMQLSPLEVVMAILVRISFGLLFMATNLLTERLFGSVINKMLILALYMLVIVVLSIPGIIAGVLLMQWGALPTALAALAPVAFWNVSVSLLVGFFCRDILNYAELNNR